MSPPERPPGRPPEGPPDRPPNTPPDRSPTTSPDRPARSRAAKPKVKGGLAELVAKALAWRSELTDIFLSPGKPVQVGVHGALAALPEQPPLTAAATAALAEELLGDAERARRELAARGSVDLPWELPEPQAPKPPPRALPDFPGLDDPAEAIAALAKPEEAAKPQRFRVNLFRRRGVLAVVLRRLPESLPSQDTLGLPRRVRAIARQRGGLVLVTGGPGAGKSTTLASIVDAIKTEREVHVITLEDPIEYVHSHGKGLVDQRELGSDFDSFATGLRAALRQAPAVVLVGEIRDAETMDTALAAAEAGLLVLGSLHTATAAQTVTRVVALFDQERERLVRSRLAETLRVVVAQRLVPRLGGGRVAAFEVLVSTLRVREAILQGGGPGQAGLGGGPGQDIEAVLADVIEKGAPEGMLAFERSLAGLVQRNLVSEKTALTHAVDRARMRALLDAMQRAAPRVTPAVPGLELDHSDAPEGSDARPRGRATGGAGLSDDEAGFRFD